MSQKKSLHDLMNGLIQNGMEDYDSCVMLAVKDEKVVFVGGLQGGEDHISPSCVRLAIALHDLLNGELKKADAIASMFEKLDKMHDIVSTLKKMSASWSVQNWSMGTTPLARMATTLSGLIG